MNAGREDLTDLDSPLSMTVLGLKGSRKANGVSSLHGEVSREMFKHLDYPIGHITNGFIPVLGWHPSKQTSSRKDLTKDWEDHFLDAKYWEKCKKK